MSSWKIASTLAIILSIASITAAACINEKQFNCYHQPGYAIQVSTNSLDFARYTESHAYTYGFGISPYTRITGSSNTSKIGAELFARRNFPVLDQFVTGIGLAITKEWGRENGQTIKNSFIGGPYLALEYAATPQILVSGTVAIINYNTQKLGNTTTRTWKVLSGGSLQLSYLFA